MARRDRKPPDGDPLGRDRFVSPGGLWRLSGEAWISTDDLVGSGQAQTTVRHVLEDAVAGYSHEDARALKAAVMRAAREIKRWQQQNRPEDPKQQFVKQRDPRVQDVQKELRKLREGLKEAARKPARDPAKVAWRLIARRTGVDECELLEAVRYEIEALPKNPRRVDPTLMAALDILARAYTKTTGERPTRYERRSQTPSPFFKLVEATYQVAGYHKALNGIDEDIRVYLDRIDS